MNSKAIVFNLTPPVSSDMDVVFSDILGIFSKPELSESDIVYLSNFVKVDVPYLGDNIINRVIGNVKRVCLLAAIEDNNEIQFLCKHNDCRMAILWRPGFGIVESNTETGQMFDVGDKVALETTKHGWIIAVCYVPSNFPGGHGPVFMGFVDDHYACDDPDKDIWFDPGSFSGAILLERKTK